MRTIALVLGIPLVASLGAVTARADCDDRPGTPNALTAEPLSPSSIRLNWTNTTGRAGAQRAAAGHGTAGHTEYFDIYVRGIDGEDMGHGVTGDGPYNVSYGSRTSRDFGGLAPGTDYCFSMRAREGASEGARTEGCVSRFASQTVCTATTVPPGTDPTMCKSGFVWRTATPADNVCVKPDVRKQTLADNKEAHRRRTGPRIFDPFRCPLANHKAKECWRYDIPCRVPFVWRNATPDDYVCVLGETRKQAWVDNARASERRVVVDSGTPPPPPPTPGVPPGEVARTCSGEAIKFARYFPVYYSNGDGCGQERQEFANSEAEAKLCARLKYGDALEDTLTVFQVATGPNGCRNSTLAAADEDKARSCGTSLCGVDCESEIGECP